jgi:hypothetical protein
MRNFLTGCVAHFTMAGTILSETKAPPKKLAEDMGGRVRLELVLVPARQFKMGSTEEENDR